MGYNFDFDLPKEPRRRFRFWRLGLIILALVILIPVIAGIVTDWAWYRELGRADVYWTMFWGRWVLGLAMAIGFFMLVFVNYAIALRSTPERLWNEFGQRLRENALYVLDRTLRRIAWWGAGIVTLLFAWAIGRAAADYWPQFLLFAHAQRMGQVDPIFQRDISFYLFRLPVWELLVGWLFLMLVVSLLITAGVYVITRTVQKVRGIPVFAPQVQGHLSVLLALIFVVKALDYHLDRYALLYARAGDFIGAGYTDVHARIPGLFIMSALALGAAGLMLLNIRRRNGLLPVYAVAGMVVASILVLGIYPGLVQRFRVEPNELRLETPYLSNHIKLTRQAYGLENISEVEFSPQARVGSAQLQAAPSTMNNIRLWDSRPLLQNYRQRQELRTYYQLNDVDIDRYQLNGQMRQVTISARELNVNEIPGTRSWVNRHLIYTHGYGAVVSPVNAYDAEKGEPIFFVNDIPPKSTVDALKMTQPEIYFGELNTDYVVVNTKQREFDYPRGGSDENATTTYRGKAGISLRNPLLRGLLAWRFGALNLLISDYVTPDSRILFRRQVLDRAQAVAPFLAFDNDPYPVIGTNGRLYWIMDGYTRSARYPYSRQTELAVAGDQTLPNNYLRNPVKAVVDAYDGTVHLYTTDANEPFIRAWRAIFPRLFAPMSAMPAGLEQHVRVPEGLFNTISEIYSRYHMTNPTEFYGQEDQWEIPEESTGGTDMVGQPVSGKMEAYYLVMSLPGQREPEYLLIRPYTPSKKQNMIAWLSAQNDPRHLGQLQVFNFPKQSLVYGPRQIETRINQAPEISEAFTLWGQAGSRIGRGNLLVIPLGDTILYVQPIYLQAEQSEIPELQRVIVADQQRVIMRRTLEEALAELIGGEVPSSSTPDVSQPNGQPPSSSAAAAAQRARARSALQHYDRAQDALKRNDWTTYGKEMEAVRRDLEALNRE